MSLTNAYGGWPGGKKLNPRTGEVLASCLWSYACSTGSLVLNIGTLVLTTVLNMGRCYQVYWGLYRITMFPFEEGSFYPQVRCHSPKTTVTKIIKVCNHLSCQPAHLSPFATL